MCDPTSNIVNVIVLSKDMSSPYNSYSNYNSNVNPLLLLMHVLVSQNWFERIFRDIIVNVSLVLAFSFQVYHIYTSRFDFELIKMLQYFVIFVCCSLSYFNVIFRLAAGQKICNRIKYDWARLSNEKEILILRKYANDSHRYVVLIIITACIYGIILISPSLIHAVAYAVHLTNNSQLIFPLPLKLFLRYDKYYYLTLISEYLVISLLCTLGAASYAGFALIVTHACALLRIVAFKIDQPFNKISNDDWSSKVKDDAYEWIKEIVKRYENATEFVDMLNGYTDKVYILEVFFSIFAVIIDFFYLLQSLQMLQSTDFKDYVYELTACILHIGGTICVLFLNCYIGQKVMDHSTRILESFYQVSLYELPPKCQKVLPLLIMRSTKPCVISIGGMFVASYDFFMQFMHMSLSYAMVCYNIR